MKNRLPLLLIVLLSSAFHENAGYLAPVQAICRVKLTTGETIEGFITVYGTSGYNYFRNGFLSVYNEHSFEFEYLFNIDFERLERYEEKGAVYYSCCKDRAEGGIIAHSLYFIEFDPDNAANSKTFQSTLDTALHTYRSEVGAINNYVVKDSIVLFLELPKSGALKEATGSEKTIKIATQAIASFELLINPGDSWKKLIPSGGFFGVRWYHVIKGDSEQLEGFKKRDERLVINK